MIYDYRSSVSVFAILIKKQVNKLSGEEVGLGKYSLEINVIYRCVFTDTSLIKSIIDYDVFIKEHKILKYRNHMVTLFLGEHDCLFHEFVFTLNARMRSTFLIMSDLKYFELQTYAEASFEDKFKMQKLQEYCYYLVKISLYFY